MNIASNGSKWIKPEKRLAIYSRDNFKCVYCLDSNNLSLDHIIPQSESVDNSPKNLVTSCTRCNSKRGNKSVYSFALTVDNMKRSAVKIIELVYSQLQKEIDIGSAKNMIKEHGSYSKALKVCKNG
jgi:CRISPR/Cas system Type II protein with McrA/HNH and RuvC-like nuclease domain